MSMFPDTWKVCYLIRHRASAEPPRAVSDAHEESMSDMGGHRVEDKKAEPTDKV